MYVGYNVPIWAEFIPPGQSYNDILFRDAGRIRSPEEVDTSRS